MQLLAALAALRMEQIAGHTFRMNPHEHRLGLAERLLGELPLRAEPQARGGDRRHMVEVTGVDDHMGWHEQGDLYDRARFRLGLEHRF